MRHPTTPPPAAKTAVTYVRVASRDPDDQARATARQLDHCLRAAETRGASVVHGATDLGASGIGPIPPGLASLLDHLQQHPADYLICADPARLRRDMLGYATITKRLQALGTQLVLADTPPTDAAPSGTAVMYARVDGRRDHIDWATGQQRRACHQYATRHHLTTIEEFIDIGACDTDTERPALTRLLNHLDTHHTDYVICSEMTILAGDHPLSHQLVLDIQRHGSQLALADLDGVLTIDVGHATPAERQDQPA